PEGPPSLDDPSAFLAVNSFTPVSPLDELPDFGLQIAGASTDLGEQSDCELEVNHRLVASALRVKQVGEVVLEGSLPVPISLARAATERVASKFDRPHAIPRVGADEGKRVERRNPHARIGRRSRVLPAARGQIVR